MVGGGDMLHQFGSTPSGVTATSSAKRPNSAMILRRACSEIVIVAWAAIAPAPLWRDSGRRLLMREDLRAVGNQVKVGDDRVRGRLE